MSKKAFIFPGQGSQYTGMIKDLYKNINIIKENVEYSSDILNIDIAKIMFDLTEEELTRTNNAQIALFVSSASILKAILSYTKKEINELCDFVAGHSLGEYVALFASGVLTYKDALSLVKKRGEFMNEESMRHDGSMAAVIGLGKDELLSIIKSINVECEIANDNTDAQKVISGKSKDVDILIDELKKHNKKVIKLKVSGAFHSKLMFGAAEKMKNELAKVEFRKPKVNFVSNVLADVDYDSESIRENLVHQIYKTVRWNESVKLLFSSGVNEVVEIGASSVLNNMIKKTHENVGTYNINDLNSFDKFLSSI